MTVVNETNPLCYRFDDVVIDCENFRIQKDGVRQTLTPRGFDVLLFLIEKRERVVEKQELFEQIWKESFVTDNALTRVIKEIRRAIGDDADAPRYIETIPKRGYRFIAELKPLSDRAAILQPDKQTVTTEPRPIPIIAVLPFKLFATNSNDDYLGLGMADALITRLSNVRQIIVRPTSSVLKYAQTEQDPVVIGRELRVESVLEASIRKSADRVRVTVQLVSVENSISLWADKFDEQFTDIFSVEDSIAERVAEALALRLSGEEKLLLKKRYTENVEAHENYMKGRFYANKFTLENFYKAVECFQYALEIDPDYALAYAGIAEANWIAGDLYLNPQEALTKTKEFSLKAVAIDDQLAEAHTFLAAAVMSQDWNWVEAEKEFRRAIELNPGFAPAHQWFGWYLSVVGQHNEAILESEKARQLDPFSIGINWFLAVSYGLARHYEESLQQSHALVKLEPYFWGGYFSTGYSYTRLGRYPEAITAYQKAEELDASPMIKGGMAEAYALAGNPEQAQVILGDLKALEKESFVPPFYIALIHTVLGENDEAFEYLEKACEMHDSSLPLIKVDERLNKLRPDPRLKDLMLRVGLAS
jgi:TolB-like protein/cytochrome c-type biogenesis protein CcmH/NrfG